MAEIIPFRPRAKVIVANTNAAIVESTNTQQASGLLGRIRADMPEIFNAQGGVGKMPSIVNRIINEIYIIMDHAGELANYLQHTNSRDLVRLEKTIGRFRRHDQYPENVVSLFDECATVDTNLLRSRIIYYIEGNIIADADVDMGAISPAEAEAADQMFG